MNRRAVFDAWAPSGARWSPWVKPVLFAHVDDDDDAPPLGPVETPQWMRDDLFTLPRRVDYRTSARAPTALVVDLPGFEGLAVGLALRERGFQPVPLYTSLPGPGREALVPMDRVLGALRAAAPHLRDHPLPGDAPPAFLLDARRAAERVAPRPGQFDNRSVSFPTDFPSGRRLRDAGIDGVVLVQSGRTEPRLDLMRTLSEWRSAGLELRLLRTDSPGSLVPLRLPRAWVLALRLLWRRSRLRGDADSGFGAAVPDLPQGG